MSHVEVVPEGTSQENLESYIAELSSVVRDKSPKSASKLFKRLLTESIGDKASRVLEFIPCKIQDTSVKSTINQRFGFYVNEHYYTTARELLNWGWGMNEVLKCVDFTNYKVFKCVTPYFIYGQISTHTQLTTVSHSQRYAECDRGYWLPESVIDYFSGIQESQIQGWWTAFINNKSPKELKAFMRDVCKEPRKEVWDRGADMLQNRVFVIGGYTNNPNAWEHFVKQRTDKHTQIETREFVKQLGLGS